MTFMEQYFAEDACAFDQTLDKIGVFIEASYRELNVNYQESEIKVLKESGTEDDLAYLMEEAQGSFKERAVAAIKKIPEAFKTWMEEIWKKLNKFFTDIKESKLITSIKAAIKKNPKVANATVEVEDTEEYEKKLDKIADKIKSKMTKIRGKKTATESDLNELEAYAEEAKKLEPKKIRISISSLLAKFEKKSGEAKKVTDGAVAAVSEGEKLVEGIDNPEAVQAITTAEHKIAFIEKLKVNKFTNFLTDTAHKFNKVKDNPDATDTAEGEATAESTVDLDDILKDIFTEAEEDTEDKKACCDEIKDMVKDLKDAVEDDDVKAAAKLASDIKDKLEDCCDDEKKDDKKDDDGEGEEVEESTSLLEDLEKELFC